MESPLPFFYYDIFSRIVPGAVTLSVLWQVQGLGPVDWFKSFVQSGEIFVRHLNIPAQDVREAISTRAAVVGVGMAFASSGAFLAPNEVEVQECSTQRPRLVQMHGAHSAGME
jgi:hypothetical protein